MPRADKVMVGPAEIALTRMPDGPRSLARYRTDASKARFGRAHRIVIWDHPLPRRDRSMSAGCRLRFISGSADFAAATKLKTDASTAVWNDARDTSRKRPLMPSFGENAAA